MNKINVKRYGAFLLVLLMGFSIALTGCGAKITSSDAKATGGTIENSAVSFEFWSAPNPTQDKFWKGMAEEYMKQNPNVKIKVSSIPEKPSSEAAIQAAIAAKSAPAASENIMRSFAATLYQSKAIVPLNKIDGWDKLVETRKMADSVKPWKLSDGNQYVMPIYNNAMQFGWRMDLLKEAGITEVPKTYSQVIEAGKKIKAKYPDKFLWASQDLGRADDWWTRWFDFLMLYDAATGGKTDFIEGTKLVADDKAALEVLTFLSELQKNNLLLPSQATDPFETGLGAFATVGPWSLPTWKEKYPDLLSNVELTLPPVPDSVNPADSKTFADAKGIVIYASVPEEQQKAAWEFIKWVFSNPDNDLKWLQETNLPPARDDTATNPAFKDFFDQNPALKKFAEAIPNSIPPMDNDKIVDLQTIMGREGVVPVVNGQKDPETAWKDMKKALQDALAK